jgi:HEAT repeat protein
MLAFAVKDVRWKLRLFSANDFRSAASYGFGVLGAAARPAVPGLIKLLADTDPDVRSGAAYCLCQIGPAAKEAVPALIQKLDDPDAHGNVFAAVRAIEPSPDLVVGALIGHLSSSNTGKQIWALSALSAVGADAKAAVPKVLKLLDSPHLLLRLNATNALKAIDPEAAAKAGVK